MTNEPKRIPPQTTKELRASANDWSRLSPDEFEQRKRALRECLRAEGENNGVYFIE